MSTALLSVTSQMKVDDTCKNRKIHWWALRILWTTPRVSIPVCKNDPRHLTAAGPSHTSNSERRCISISIYLNNKFNSLCRCSQSLGEKTKPTSIIKTLGINKIINEVLTRTWCSWFNEWPTQVYHQRTLIPSRLIFLTIEFKENSPSGEQEPRHTWCLITF